MQPEVDPPYSEAAEAGHPEAGPDRDGQTEPDAEQQPPSVDPRDERAAAEHGTGRCRRGASPSSALPSGHWTRAVPGLWQLQGCTADALRLGRAWVAPVNWLPADSELPADRVVHLNLHGLATAFQSISFTSQCLTKEEAPLASLWSLAASAPIERSIAFTLNGAWRKLGAG